MPVAICVSIHKRIEVSKEKKARLNNKLGHIKTDKFIYESRMGKLPRSRIVQFNFFSLLLTFVPRNKEIINGAALPNFYAQPSTASIGRILDIILEKEERTK